MTYAYGVWTVGQSPQLSIKGSTADLTPAMVKLSVQLTHNMSANDTQSVSVLPVIELP
jgi:hypothetical protein